MSHSKHNTSLAFFTAHERAELRSTWGSQSTRLTRDSYLPFASCQLCLLPTRDPVSCPSHGHLFCRECAISNLLAQKKEVRRIEKEWERRRGEVEEVEKGEREREMEAEVRDFEGVQMGLEVRVGGKRGTIVGSKDGRIVVEERDGSKGTKRKFEVDEEEVLKTGKENGANSRRKVEKQDKKSLPSFWVPSETPDSGKEVGDRPSKTAPACPASAQNTPHEFSLKTLVTVNFTEEKDSSSGDVVRSCPACKKALSNTTKAILAKPCGHVVCKPCADKFLKPTEKHAHDEDSEVGVVSCYVCQGDITERKAPKKDKGEKKKEKDKIRPGLVEISTEGTGFAGGGKNMIKKSGLAFQC